jgi:hypothetical protein
MVHFFIGGQVEQELLTKEELGRRLSIKPQAIARLTQQGKIPAVKISHKIIRYDFAAVMLSLHGAAHAG